MDADPQQSADDLPAVAKLALIDPSEDHMDSLVGALIDELGKEIEEASKHIDRRPPRMLIDMGGPKSRVPIHGVDDTVTIRPELVPALVSKLEGAGKAAEVGT